MTETMHHNVSLIHIWEAPWREAQDELVFRLFHSKRNFLISVENFISTGNSDFFERGRLYLENSVVTLGVVASGLIIAEA